MKLFVLYKNTWYHITLCKKKLKKSFTKNINIQWLQFPNLPRSCTIDVNRSYERNGFIPKKAKHRKYCRCRLRRWSNASRKYSCASQSLLHRLEETTIGIGFYMNSKFMFFKQDRAISILDSKPLKLVDHFSYLSSNISSMENDVNMCITKAWTVIDR